jgi:VWFA-related protein
MWRRGSGSGWSGLGWIAAWSCGLAAATALPAQPVEEFSGTLDVVVVELPVDVLADGRPVRGLSREQFELYEDGARREITGFAVVDHARLPELDESGVTPAPAPGERRNVLLLLDLLFSSQVEQRRTLLAARRFVDDSLGAADFAAIAVSGVVGGSRLIVPFTTDRAWLAAGLDLVGAIHSGKRREVEQARRALLPFAPAAEERIARLASELGPTMALLATTPSGYLAVEESAAQLGREQVAEPSTSDLGIGSVLHDDPSQIASELAASAVSATAVNQLDGIAALLAALRDLPGRKLLLFFSRGFDAEMLRRRDSLDRPELLSALERTVASARRSGWAMHPIDLAGVPEVGQTAFNADPLLVLAKGTGGRLRENFNEFDEAAARVLAESEVTYWLSYQRPPLIADGRLHEIEVRLVGAPPGARAVHRGGLQAPLPERARSALDRRLDRAATLLGEREIAEIDVVLGVFPRPASDGRWRVDVALEVDERWGDRLAMPGGEPVFEVEAYLIDAGFGVADRFAARVRLDPARHAARLATGGLLLTGRLEAPPGEYRLRVAVRDPATSRVALQGHVVRLGEPALWRPLTSRSAGVAIALATRGAVGEPDDPFATAGRAFAPLRTVGAGDAVDFDLVAAGVGPAAGPPTAVVVDAAGRVVARAEVDAARRPAPAGIARWRARLDAGGLAAGDYRIEISLAAEASRLRRDDRLRVTPALGVD